MSDPMAAIAGWKITACPECGRTARLGECHSTVPGQEHHATAAEVEVVPASQLAGAVDTLGNHLAIALAYASAHPNVPKKWLDEAANDLAAYRGQS